MNPLTFFPPPSRSLSRVDSRPTSSGSGGSGNGQGHGSSGSSRPVRRTLQPLTSSSSNIKQPSSSSLSQSQSRQSNGGLSSGHRQQSNDGSSSSPSSELPSGATTPEKQSMGGSTSDVKSAQATLSKRPTLQSSQSASDIVHSSSPRLSAFASGFSRETSYVGSDADVHNKSRQGSGQNSPRRESKTNMPRMYRTDSGSKAAQTSSGGRLGHRLPQGLYFDFVRPQEVGSAFKLEKEGYNIDDAAKLDTLRYRQQAAPHLFLGAFLPVPPPKVSGPLSMSGPSPRKLIGYACGTAASALTARSMKFHSDDEHAWLVCAHSVCVASEFRHKGLALKLIEEYIRRLRRAEESGEKKGYECVACLSHEETLPLFKKAGFKVLGVSHVNVGKGNWFELRRQIVPHDDEDDDDKEQAVTGSDGSDKHGVQSQPSSRGESALLESTELEAGAITTPTQELERRLQEHVDTLKEQKHASAEQHSDEAEKDASDLQQSPLAMSPSVQSPTLEKQLSLLNVEAASPLPQANPFSTSQIMQALQQQSSSNAKKGDGPRNPGIAYSTIMGQTLASKTSMEDAFFALEARLVNRDDQTNLGDLYCPREECGGLLLKGGTADWDIAEMGPLMQANFHLPDSPTPPSAPTVPPPKASLESVRSALGTHRPAHQTTPAHAFWIVSSPMLFENIGFSKDAEWRVPPTHSASISSVGSEGTAKSSATDGSNTSGATNGGERRKPVKRGSLLRSPTEWIREKEAKARERRNAAAAAASEGKDVRSPMSFSPPSVHSPPSSSNSSASNLPAAGQTLVKVKYLTCAECDCGPLGYTVLPRSMEGGAFAQDVGKQTQGEASSEMAKEQLFFVAADRVRYRLPK